MALTDPADNLLPVALAAVLLGFSSATQDIVIDAYRIESADADMQSMLSSMYIAGYRIGMLVAGTTDLDAIFRRLNSDFEHGLKLVRQKTGRTRFFITREALEKPDRYIADILVPTDEKHPRLPLKPDNLLEGDPPK